MAELKYASLPVYTPSEPSPRYSCEPACDEHTLQQTPRHSSLVPSGAYTQTSGKVTVTLFEQENGVDIPTYGRRADISGTIYLENHDRVSQVVVKVEGKLDSTISEGGSKSIITLSRSQTLWRKEMGNELPTLIPFSCELPSHFTYLGSERPLPPTYYLGHCGSPAFYIRSQYTISVRVTRARHRNMEFLRNVDDVKIPFIYYPRTRAHRPIIPSPSFFSTVKTSPEEWYQVLYEMKMRTPSKVEPIHCHLFIPAGRVYGLSDKIPFHIQLNGPLDSLQKLLMPQPLDAPPPPLWSSKTHEKCPIHKKPKIRVYILRQYSIETRGQKAWKNTTIGEGEIWEVPPAICDTQGATRAVHLDWEGELKVQSSVTVGGFLAGNVCVKDFIVLSLEPPTIDSQTSPFFPLQITVPVRIVTDAYVEVTEYEPPPAA
ncbi:hypothetical protein D9615_002730 [Tricholomella constricta]|uniref:Uncharacterized protein n=1 Tax=Tricholomella constricta TaxID=117010 RepID=A0A8H5HFM0_9AGAR|nr:hypothetical protein D9615_002730 [Tricholomella constricta]